MSTPVPGGRTHCVLLCPFNRFCRVRTTLSEVTHVLNVPQLQPPGGPVPHHRPLHSAPIQTQVHIHKNADLRTCSPPLRTFAIWHTAHNFRMERPPGLTCCCTLFTEKGGTARAVDCGTSAHCPCQLRNAPYLASCYYLIRQEDAFMLLFF